MKKKYGIVICARNERLVIGNLIDSIRAQTYDPSLLTIFVVADNCTDNTAAVAAAGGAKVFQRFNTCQVGKGYALHYLLEQMRLEGELERYDAFLIFDADNLLQSDYIRQINLVRSQGYDVFCGYRNSKNFGSSWISSGHALWYLHESAHLNQSRMLLGNCCTVSGTGFGFTRQLLDRIGGWNFFTLTEDIEFRTWCATHGITIGYCHDAVLYDEQPTTFSQSWRQRQRWAKGYIQVFHHYGRALLRGIAQGSWACFDMTMNIMPAFFLSAVSIVCNLTSIALGLISGGSAAAALWSLGELLLGVYGTLFVVGAITTATEWRAIGAAWWKKVLYTFTFPLFMATYIPIAISALFCRVEWKPIEHRVTASQLRRRKDGSTLPF